MVFEKWHRLGCIFRQDAGYLFVPTSPRHIPCSLKNSSVLFSSLLYIMSTCYMSFQNVARSHKTNASAACQLRGMGRRVRKITAALSPPRFSKTSSALAGGEDKLGFLREVPALFGAKSMVGTSLGPAHGSMNSSSNSEQEQNIRHSATHYTPDLGRRKISKGIHCMALRQPCPLWSPMPTPFACAASSSWATVFLKQPDRSSEYNSSCNVALGIESNHEYKWH